MEEVAAAAHVSKQTVYSHFESKEALFADLVLGNASRVDGFIAGIEETLEGPGELGERLQALARQYLGFVIRPEVLRLRRLVLAEAPRFPELAKTYYERVPERVYAALARALGRHLRLDDPVVAAHHFAWLVLGTPLDEAMFTPGAAVPDTEWVAAEAVRVFLAAYGGRRAS